MTEASVELQGALPPSTNMRVGIAHVSGGVTTVTVSGNLISCGFLDDSTIADGVSVALLRFGSIWLCLGRINAQP